MLSKRKLLSRSYILLHVETEEIKIVISVSYYSFVSDSLIAITALLVFLAIYLEGANVPSRHRFLEVSSQPSNS